MPPKKVYSKKDPISHILDRSDMYVGSKKLRKLQEYVADKNEEDEYKIFRKEIESSPAILRIFVEIVSNAIDNVERSRKAKIPCTTIKVNIDKETGETSVWNDGDVVPIEINEEEKIYNHTLIFGNLLTGSNYNDEEERLISGRNGLGSKATNVFSKKFIVKGLDPHNKKILEQTWTNNMRTVSEPKISETKLKTGYTKITYFPDFKQFGLDGYTDDIIKLYTKYVIDSAMLTKVKVYLNDELLPVNDLLSYSKLYDSISEEHLILKTSGSEVLVTTSGFNEFEAISFVNGVYTRLGGQHVESWSETIFRPIVEKFNKKSNKPKVNIGDIKKFFRLFIVSTVVNPEFSSQDKEKLESPSVESSIKTAEINKLFKWSVISEIDDMIKMKEMVVLKKAEKKKKGYTKIEGLDPANNAGGKNGYQCSLILCEGLSAKTYAVAGIEKGVYGRTGRDYFGILPLRGKLLNCRNSIPSVIAKNKVITDLIQALGLRHDVDYTDDKNYKTLSYGKVILLTDADVDGLHISSLIMNFFHVLFPTILQREEPYIVSMATPIVRVFNPKGDLLFYDENRFKKFQNEQVKSFKSKYYKGLGTTKPEDVPDTFGLKMIEYNLDESATQTMNKAFHVKFSDSRKDWLEKYDPTVSKFCLDDEKEVVNMSISDYLNNELIKFSHNDCKRSIPSLIDGLKESQRKILYAVKKRNLTYNKQSLKVAQLGGYVAEHTNYHHGEQNLYETIIKMANEFPGSNNIPLLYRDGQFGSRINGGKDAASARYIFTKMETLTPLLFREEDDVLLERVVDDGDIVEPKFYIPILPMILINGCTAGIGTGWSCNVPCFNPLDVINAVKEWLEYDGEVLIKDPDDDTTLSMLSELKPWYRGYEGTIEKQREKFVSYGNINKDKNKVEVTELPVGMWTDKFKEFCEDLLVEKQIKNMKNNSSTRKVKFTITESDDGIICNTDTLKLYSYLHITNMVLFDEKERLKKYSIDQIINDFCVLRYEYYIRRKNYILKVLDKDLKHSENKARFIQEIIDKKLNIMNIEEEVVVKDLEKCGYDKEYKNEESENNENNHGYNYLLKLQVRTFTANKVNELKDDIAKIKDKINNIKNTTEKQMWMNDLEEFSKEYTKWLDIMDKIDKNDGKGKKVTKPRKKIIDE
jgi:DNA topoisomerase-2